MNRVNETIPGVHLYYRTFFSLIDVFHTMDKLSLKTQPY